MGKVVWVDFRKNNVAAQAKWCLSDKVECKIALIFSAGNI